MNFIYSKLYMSIIVLVTIVMSQFFLIAEEQTLIDKSTDGDELTLEPTKNKKDMTGVYNKDVYLRCQITDPVNVRTLTVSPITDADEAVDMKTVKGHASVYELLGNKDGSLTIQGVQSVKRFGTFGMVITGTVKKEAKGKGESTQESSWDFSGTGIGLVKKCTLPYKVDHYKTAWDPAGKNLVGYPITVKEHVINVTRTDLATWSDLSKLLKGWSQYPEYKNYELYGFFVKPLPMSIEILKKENNLCTVCKKNACYEIEYLYDFEFGEPSITVLKFNITPNVGPLTNSKLSQSLAYIRAHEINMQKTLKMMYYLHFIQSKSRINAINILRLKNMQFDLGKLKKNEKQ